MNGAWRTYVVSLCRDAWKLDPHRTRRVIEGIEVLLATDQLSEFSLAGVLSGVGMGEPGASVAARTLRDAIGSTRRPHARAAPGGVAG